MENGLSGCGKWMWMWKVESGKWKVARFRISQLYKNYENRLRLAKVIVQNKIHVFYGSLCRIFIDYGALSAP